MSAGVLSGLRVLDLSALGPGPFGSRTLADLGAEVTVVEPPVSDPDDSQRMFGRNKRSIVLDLKASAGREIALELAARCDVLIESMRPGKMEALGLGPDVMRAKNPRLIYVRLTAFGQHGPLASAAGHDINAIAIGGALSLVGLDQPLPPAALVGDFASGGAMIVAGVLLSVIRRAAEGVGGVVDVAMSDGAAYLAGGLLPMFNKGEWGPRGANLIDGSRPFYTTYRCADGKWIAVGAIEPKFFFKLVETLGLLDQIDPAQQHRRDRGEAFKQILGARFAEKTRDEWAAIFEGVDACVSPVLELSELSSHPHHRARNSVFEGEDGVHANIAPRLEGAAAAPHGRSPRKGEHTLEVLEEAGIHPDRIRAALASGAIQVEAGEA